VQTLVRSVVVVGAVNVEPANAPPFVHATVGPVVTATLSVAVKVELPVAPEVTVNVSGLKETVGAVVSAGGGGGGGGGGGDVDPLQLTSVTAAATETKTVMGFFILHRFSINLSGPNPNLHLFTKYGVKKTIIGAPLLEVQCGAHVLT
jgi:hypothetical protein